MGLLKRTGDVVRSKAEKRVSSLETAEVIASTTMREIDKAVALMQAHLHAVKTDLIRNKEAIRSSTERGETLERQAQVQEALGNHDMAVEILAQALEEKDIARSISSRLSEAEQADAQLTEAYRTMRLHQRQARAIISIEMSKWRAADARARAAKTYYGEIGSTTESPFEKLDTLRSKVLDASASSAAAIEIGEMDHPAMLDTVDYTAQARAQLTGSAPDELSAGEVEDAV